MQLFRNYKLSLIQHIIYLTAGLTFFTFTLETTSGYLNYLDLFTTVFPNESLINSYYFWWTNPNYVTFFLSCFTFFTFFHLSRSIKFTSLLLLVFVEIWFNEWRDIWNANVQINVLTTLVPQVNLLLLNSLNKYHPFILYLSLLLSVNLLTTLISHFFKTTLFSKTWDTEYKTAWPATIILINFVALFFGSWWALQEGTWGGWWNWDPSELFGLLPSLILLRVLHVRDSVSSLWSSILLSSLSILATLLTYLILQLNFELISHNFGPKFFFFFNSNLFSAFLSTTLLFFFYKVSKNLSTSKIRTFLTKNRSYQMRSYRDANSRSYLQILPFTILVLWVVVSFWDFFNSFIKNFMSITLTNLETISFLNLSLLVILVSLFSSMKSSNILPITQSSLYPIFSSTGLPFIHVCVHLSLAYFNFLNLVIDDLSIFNWSFASYSEISYDSTTLFWSTQRCLTLDSWNIDNARSNFDPNGYMTLSWSTANTSNTESGNIFTLILTPSAVNNYYELGSSYIDVFLSIHLPMLTSVTVFAFLSIAPLTLIYKAKLN